MTDTRTTLNPFNLNWLGGYLQLIHIVLTEPFDIKRIPVAKVLGIHGMQ